MPVEPVHARRPCRGVGPPALGQRDAGARLQADADRLNSIADAIARATVKSTMPGYPARGVDAAEVRLDQSLAEFQSAITATAADASAISGQTNLKHALANLGAIPGGSNRSAPWFDGLRQQVAGSPAISNRRA